LDRISRTVCSIASRNSLDRVVEEQVRLVEEEHQLRLVEVPYLGQVVEQVREQPHQEGGEQRRPVLDGGQFQAGDEPLPSGAVRSRSRVSNSGSPKKTSAPWSSNAINSRRITPAVAGQPAEISSARTCPHRTVQELK
jgi:hypothetical protein